MVEIVATTPVGKVPHGLPVRVAPETPLVEVVAAMKQARRGAVVVEVGGRLVGVFTERDLMTRIDFSDPGWRNRSVQAMAACALGAAWTIAMADTARGHGATSARAPSNPSRRAP